ncbi:uncharacterized protein LOC122313060 isoform X2 [Carya illinoinensis]|uniref:uncharacterized protein LOC122313060 isoform X2 n=1 Tax=Carya illinoinensis TaxID=32201 RepID=UPI001C71B604|nr:uncharacterized protein LOC122313060 isoform X2 [Carya illinoinensis]
MAIAKQANTEREMERIQELEWMKLCMKKLALWLTRTFNPIMTHDDLEPLMATLGFVALPPSPPHPASTPWKEYLFTAGASFSTSLDSADSPPKPRLPFPRIDGLHVNTYKDFLDAVNFYINMPNISDLFHVSFLSLLSQTNDAARGKPRTDRKPPENRRSRYGWLFSSPSTGYGQSVHRFPSQRSAAVLPKNRAEPVGFHPYS